jgi:photosystem II stability/assembly factor-like uncharacterized protein
MNDDERFDHDLRATLDGLAREPAPERLVARVAGIPSRQPALRTHGLRLHLSPMGFASGFGLLAAGIAIAVLAIVVRPGAGPSTVGGSPSFTSPPAGSPGPTSTPAAAPSSAAPVGSPSPKPQGSPVPVGFEPMSATFVSADVGWVLGSVPCGSSRCPAIARTTDGGATWSAIAAPKTTVGNGSEGLPQAGGSGISSLRFADTTDGWAFGPELWATHDGGASWVRVSVPGLPAAATVTSLETAAGLVHAVLYDAAQDFRIASSRTGADAWRVAAVRVPVGAGPVPQIELVLSGASGWVLENDRTVVGGARLDAGAWRSWQPVCLDVVGPAVLAASSQRDLVAICDVGLWSNAQGEHMFASTDGGAAFAETGTRPPISSATAVATPGRSTIAVAGSDTIGAAIVASYDGGRTWSTVLRAGAVRLVDLGFTTPTQGIVITTDEAGAGHLLMTHDAGQTWTRVAF